MFFGVQKFGCPNRYTSLPNSLNISLSVSKDSLQKFFMFLFLLFNWGQTQGGRLTHPMWITGFCLCSTQRSMGVSYQGWILSLAKCLVGLWTGNLPVCLQCLNSLSCSLYSLLTGGNTEIFFGWQQYEEERRLWSSAHKKQLEICIVYIH